MYSIVPAQNDNNHDYQIYQIIQTDLSLHWKFALLAKGFSRMFLELEVVACLSKELELSLFLSLLSSAVL